MALYASQKFFKLLLDIEVATAKQHVEALKTRYVYAFGRSHLIRGLLSKRAAILLGDKILEDGEPRVTAEVFASCVIAASRAFQQNRPTARNVKVSASRNGSLSVYWHTASISSPE